MFKLGDILKCKAADLGEVLILSNETWFDKILFVTGKRDGDVSFIPHSKRNYFEKVGNIFEKGAER